MCQQWGNPHSKRICTAGSQKNRISGQQVPMKDVSQAEIDEWPKVEKQLNPPDHPYHSTLLYAVTLSHLSLTHMQTVISLERSYNGSKPALPIGAHICSQDTPHSGYIFPLNLIFHWSQQYFQNSKLSFTVTVQAANSQPFILVFQITLGCYLFCYPAPWMK